MNKEITIIGSGNVANHFIAAFKELAYSISIYGRNIEAVEDLALKYNSKIQREISKINNELVLICVSDNSISEIIEQLDESNKICYTAGSIELNTLPAKPNIGVFYPLQTFTVGRPIHFETIPLLIEANNKEFEITLFELAKQLSKNVQLVNSKQRKEIHLAAVFANNFTNHLIYLAKNQLKEKNIDENILNSLISETISKAIELDPKQIQTGPAKRNDIEVLDAHLIKLDGNQKNIYRAITDSILETYNHEKL